MHTYLDTKLWKRQDLFNFFKDYDNPFFNVCANVDVTALYDLVRSIKAFSFSIAYHFLSLKAANETEPFKYRLRGDSVIVHEHIHGGSTVLLDDERFTFFYFDYDETFERFHGGAKAALNRARAANYRPDPNDVSTRDDLIHYSVLPWVSFTSVSNARHWGRQDSVPKMVFGKCFREGDSVKMPHSVEVHHALMDGLHVGRYFEKLEGYFFDPHSALGIKSRSEG
jgi:chloramphenicol O-acetyltransferase type A